MNVWVAFDTETTGIELGSRLLDLGAVAFDDAGRVVSTFTQLVNPGMPIPADVIAVHGITTKMLADQPATAAVLQAFIAWLPKRSTLIAHNAPYDCDILTWEFQRAAMPLPKVAVIDTCKMAKTLAETPDNKLQTLIRHHGLKRAGKAHRALPDADAVRQYFTYARTRIVPEPMPWTGRYGCPPALPTAISQLPTWIAAGQRIRIGYKDKQGDVSERDLTPYGYAVTASGLQVHGWCHLAENRRQFYVDRMKVLDQGSKPKPTSTSKRRRASDP